MSHARNSTRLPASASNQLIYCFLENRSKKSTVDQVVLLIKNIKDFFETKNKKANAIFVNLIAAYGTTIAYKLGFNCKLLRFLGHFETTQYSQLGCGQSDVASWVVASYPRLRKTVSSLRETILLQNRSKLIPF